MTRRSTTIALALAVALGVPACSVPDLDLGGLACPCVSGWICETATNTCVRSPTIDGDPTADARIDAPPGTIDGAAADAPPGTCPATYNVLARYRVNTTAASWASAYADCNDDDDPDGTYPGHTHLVVIGADAERLQLMSAINPMFGANKWIGLTDVEPDGDYEWITPENTAGYPGGSTSSQGIPPWANNEPDGGSERCGRVRTNWDLEDRACTDGNQYICECDAYVAP